MHGVRVVGDGRALRREVDGNARHTGLRVEGLLDADGARRTRHALDRQVTPLDGARGRRIGRGHQGPPPQLASITVGSPTRWTARSDPSRAASDSVHRRTALTRRTGGIRAGQLPARRARHHARSRRRARRRVTLTGARTDAGRWRRRPDRRSAARSSVFGDSMLASRGAAAPRRSERSSRVGHRRARVPRHRDLLLVGRPAGDRRAGGRAPLHGRVLHRLHPREAARGRRPTSSTRRARRALRQQGHQVIWFGWPRPAGSVVSPHLDDTIWHYYEDVARRVRRARRRSRGWRSSTPGCARTRDTMRCLTPTEPGCVHGGRVPVRDLRGGHLCPVPDQRARARCYSSGVRRYAFAAARDDRRRAASHVPGAGSTETLAGATRLPTAASTRQASCRASSRRTTRIARTAAAAAQSIAEERDQVRAPRGLGLVEVASVGRAPGERQRSGRRTAPTTSRSATNGRRSATAASPRGIDASEPRHRSWITRTGITRFASGMNQPADRPPRAESLRAPVPSTCWFFAARQHHTMKHRDDRERDEHEHDVRHRDERVGVTRATARSRSQLTSSSA